MALRPMEGIPNFQPDKPKNPDLKLVKKKEDEVLADNLMDLQKKPEVSLKPTQAEYDEAMAETKERLNRQTSEKEIDNLYDKLFTGLTALKQVAEVKPLPKSLVVAREQFKKAGKENLYNTLTSRYEEITAGKLTPIIDRIQNSSNKEEKLNLFDELANTISANLDLETAGNLIKNFSNDKPKVGFMRRMFGGKRKSQQEIYQEAFYQATGGTGRETQLTGGTVSKAQTRGDINRGENENKNWGQPLT